MTLVYALISHLLPPCRFFIDSSFADTISFPSFARTQTDTKSMVFSTAFLLAFLLGLVLSISVTATDKPVHGDLSPEDQAKKRGIELNNGRAAQMGILDFAEEGESDPLRRFTSSNV